MELKGLKDYEIEYLHYIKRKNTAKSKSHLDKEEQRSYLDLSYL